MKELKYCPECIQMTNHKVFCLKCVKKAIEQRRIDDKESREDESWEKKIIELKVNKYVN